MQQPTEPKRNIPTADDADDAAGVGTLLSEMDNRYDFGGLLLISRATGKPERTLDFTRDEIDLPGYIEHVERGYRDTPWRTQRLWSTVGPPSPSDA